MDNKSANILNILLPIFLLAGLPVTALIDYPIIFDKSKLIVITVFVAIVIYLLLWRLIRPDSFSRNGDY